MISVEAGAPVIEWQFEDGGTDLIARVKPIMFVNNIDTAIELRALRLVVGTHIILPNCAACGRRPPADCIAEL